MTTKQISEALDILTRADQHWKSSWIFFLYSGGYDSLCSTSIGVAWARDIGIEHKVKVISLDTGVAADGWRDYVTRVARREHWNHEIWDNPDPEFYFKNVLEFGTPYTRQMHWQIMYRNLKERTLDAVRRAHKTSQRDRCLLISGMRRDESPQRANTPEMLADGAALWVSPVVYWRDTDIYEHRVSHSFEPNPFYETVGGSGDCCCNWTCKVKLARLKQYSPILAAKIEVINPEIIQRHGYGYGERPSQALLAERAGQMTLPGIEPVMNLCGACNTPKPDASVAAEWRQLQEWS